jgi:4-diphosphocytidyl-2-C-methyl-D-erythritol kinase
MLHITGRRDDGYHLLETVFQFIDLVDHIEFSTNDEGSIERLPGDSPVVAAEDILLITANLLQSRFQVDKGVSIGIDKRIPVGGGLGGGSSDAAACLLALNRLWGLDLSLDELAGIGLELGADVPVFVRGRAAWASGVGEELQPIELEQPIYLVIDPKVAVSTAQIFAAQELTRNCDPITIRAFLRGSGSNVCEPVVRKLYPQVGVAIDWLSQYAAARMSGTGACVFAAVDSLEQAEVVKSRLPRQWDAYITRAMNCNPVHQQLGLLD